MSDALCLADPLEERLSKLLEDIRRETRIPGIGAVVEVGGRRVAVATGVRVLDEPEPMTVDSHFHIGCIAKLLASLGVLELAREGTLDLNAPIQEYLPELRGTVHGQQIALVHLLSHTSGYHGTEVIEPATSSFTWDRFIEYLVSAPQFFSPGSVFNYEHTGAVLIGEIVRRVASLQLDELTRDAILAPLGLFPGQITRDQNASRLHVGQHEPTRNGRCRKTSWSAYYETAYAPFPEFWRPAYSFHSLSLSDIARLGTALMGATDAEGHEHSKISLSSVSQIQRTVVQLPQMVGDTGLLPRAFGLAAAEYRAGWFGLDVTSIGQCVGMRINPVQFTSIAVGINAFAPYLRDLITASVCGLLRSQSPERHLDAPFELDFAELEGHYKGNGSRECDVRSVNGCLTCEFGTASSNFKIRADLVLDDDGRVVFRSSVPGITVGFFRIRDGTGIGLMSGYAAYKKLASPQRGQVANPAS